MLINELPPKHYLTLPDGRFFSVLDVLKEIERRGIKSEPLIIDQYFIDRLLGSPLDQYFIVANSVKSFYNHVLRVTKSSTIYPIIILSDYMEDISCKCEIILDGNHRILKAIIEGEKRIPAHYLKFEFFDQVTPIDKLENK